MTNEAAHTAEASEMSHKPKALNERGRSNIHTQTIDEHLMCAALGQHQQKHIAQCRRQKQRWSAAHCQMGLRAPHSRATQEKVNMLTGKSQYADT